MRQYRGKTKDGKWVEGWYIEFLDCSWISQLSDRDVRFFNESFVQVIPETVGQDTGLKDKNGVEIYEGYICKETCESIVLGGKPSENGWRPSTLPIEFHDGGFMFGYHCLELSFFIRYCGLKVIGNIHEGDIE